MFGHRIPEGEDKTRMISLFNTSKPEPFLDFEPAQDDAPFRPAVSSLGLLTQSIRDLVSES